MKAKALALKLAALLRVHSVLNRALLALVDYETATADKLKAQKNAAKS